MIRARHAVFTSLDRLSAPWRKTGLPSNPFSELGEGPVLDHMRPFLLMEDFWGAAATLRHHLNSELPGRFFAGVFDDALVPRFSADDRQQIVATADSLCQGRFDLLGYQQLTFGDPVDWHLDPVARRRVPLAHWSRIDPFDVALCGDSRIIWQLNRHQWLVSLGEAYRFTGDERYAKCFNETIRDWIRVNPAGMGINWVSSLEVAHRLIAWCWALALFWPASVVTPDFLTLMLNEIRLHAEHVRRYHSTHSSPGSPRTVEGLALFYAGIVFREFRLAEQWRRAGLDMVGERILADVSPEGVYYELSTAHQRRAIESYLHFLILAGRNAEPIAPVLRARVESLLTTLLRLQRPDGLMMRIGHTDEGGLLPLLPRARDDWRGVYGVAAGLFGDAHYAWAAGGRPRSCCGSWEPLGGRCTPASRPRPLKALRRRNIPKPDTCKCAAAGSASLTSSFWMSGQRSTGAPMNRRRRICSVFNVRPSASRWSWIPIFRDPPITASGRTL